MASINQDENLLNINDINSAGSGLKNNNPSKLPWKKFLIICGILLFVIIAIFILIFILTKKNSNNNENKEKKQEEEENNSKIGRIKCLYNKYRGDIQILGEDFIKNSDFDIYINNTKMNYSKVYNLNSYDTNIVEIILYSNLSMDNMFKDVSELISIEMSSLNYTKILSMTSTFENCNNLESFSVSGFDVSELKSMKKLFYNTNLKDYNFDNFNTNNLEDISYMFASSTFYSFKFPNINTENIIDMSYLFANCSSLNKLDISSLKTSKA